MFLPATTVEFSESFVRRTPTGNTTMTLRGGCHTRRHKTAYVQKNLTKFMFPIQKHKQKQHTKLHRSQPDANNSRLLKTNLSGPGRRLFTQQCLLPHEENLFVFSCDLSVPLNRLKTKNNFTHVFPFAWQSQQMLISSFSLTHITINHILYLPIFNLATHAPFHTPYSDIFQSVGSLYAFNISTRLKAMIFI